MGENCILRCKYNNAAIFFLYLCILFVTLQFKWNAIVWQWLIWMLIWKSPSQNLKHPPLGTTSGGRDLFQSAMYMFRASFPRRLVFEFRNTPGKWFQGAASIYMFRVPFLQRVLCETTLEVGPRIVFHKTVQPINYFHGGVPKFN